MILTSVIQKNWQRQLLILALGALSSFAMQPYEIWPFLLIGLSGLWILITQNQKIWQSFLSGFLFGFGYFVAGLWWVGNALLVDGNPFIWALPLAIFGLQALLSFFLFMAGGMSQGLAKGRSLPCFLAFVAFLSFWEWGRGHMFTGFPWNLFGMTWTSSLAMAQIASIGGIHFLNAATILLMTWPAFLWQGQSRRNTKIILTVILLFLVAGNYTWGTLRLAKNARMDDKDVVVQIITPNISQRDKWNPELMATNFYKTIQLMHPDAMIAPGAHKAGKTRAIVLPETALLPEVFASPEAMNALTTALKSYPERTYLLSGALRRENEMTNHPLYFNSLIAMDQSGKILNWFDKFHLVPFGEYMPFQKYIPFGPVAKFAGFQGGGGPTTLSDYQGLPAFSPLICYEIIFAGHVTDADTKKRPQWIVNVTNDAWYGDSPGPRQHLAQAQFRSIEEGIPVIRSTNTGISALIDPVGRVVTQSAINKEAVQEEYLPKPLAEQTIYSGRKDEVFFALLILLVIPRLIQLLLIKKPYT